MEEEMFSIFTESTEDLGVFYRSYEPVLGITSNFLNDVERNIKEMNENPFETDIDLSTRINAFKKDINRNYKPDPIVISKIKNTTKKIQNFSKELDKLLSRYVKARNSISYGGNFKRDSINKPKVYSKDIDEKKYARVNNNIRNVNRAMDWIEKVLIDLFNMADQDLNILTIVNKVYAKQHIYEGVEDLPAGVVEEEIADSVIPMLPTANGTKPMEEAPWLYNTRNKKTGAPPTYLSRNHDMANYIPGEDNEDKDLDYYKRPSSIDEPESPKNIEPEDDFDDEEELTPKEKQQAVQNYYYYTYNNSLNKNSNSFNKDSSTHDSHSKYDDYSRHTDDHSRGKHINSHNNEKDDKVSESILPWKLNIFGDDSIMEANDGKPESDHPIRDTMMDIDRETAKYQQGAKKKVQDVQNTGRAIVKPIKRAGDWIGKVIGDWKDLDETKLKEKMTEPRSRHNLFSAVRKAVTGGMLLKAGVLLNPAFLFLSITKGVGDKHKSFRIRNEIIGEIKAEIEITEEKIRDAEYAHDNKAKYELMRFKNELEKKLYRVSGDDASPLNWKQNKRWREII